MRTVNLTRIGLLALVFGWSSACTGPASDPPLDDCVWCGSMDAPQSLGNIMRIAGKDEPGDRIVITGVLVDEQDQPIPNALVYAYHTDTTGHYRKDGNETGNGRRHGILRGWLRTSSSGSFEIHTIRPAPYPSHTEPAHIHITVTREGHDEIPVHPLWFAGDQRITQALLDTINLPNMSSPILVLEQSSSGAMTASCRLKAISTMD